MVDAYKQFKKNDLNMEAVCHYFSVPIVSAKTARLPINGR